MFLNIESINFKEKNLQYYKSGSPFYIINYKIVNNFIIDIEAFNDKLLNFDNFCYIPHRFSSRSFFSELILAFKYRQDNNQYSDKINNTLSFMKSIFASEENRFKLINFGLDEEGINIALINNDFAKIADFCKNNTEQNIYKIAHNFMLTPIARKLWSHNENSDSTSFFDIQNLILNGVECKIDGISIIIDKKNIFSEMFNMILKNFGENVETHELDNGMLEIVKLASIQKGIALSALNDLEFTCDKTLEGHKAKTVATLIRMMAVQPGITLF